MIVVEVELLQVPGQTPVGEHADLISGEPEFRNILVEPRSLVSSVVSGHGIGQIINLVTR